MDNPEYILTDIFGEIATAIKAERVMDVLNYQYGYITSLNETLAQWSKTQDFAKLKFPCIWLQQPYTVKSGTSAQYFGKVEGLKLFIMTSTKIDKKAEQHMNDVFKPILHPIYRELLNQINLHPAFSVQSKSLIPHLKTDRYWWGSDQQDEIVDVVDVCEIVFLELLINHNQNCQTFSNF